MAPFGSATTSVIRLTGHSAGFVGFQMNLLRLFSSSLSVFVSLDNESELAKWRVIKSFTNRVQCALPNALEEGSEDG